MQASVPDNNYMSLKQREGLPQQQQGQLLPVTVMTTCYMQPMPSSLSSSQASKPVLQVVPKPLAEAHLLPQYTQGMDSLPQACPVASKGQAARRAPLAARPCLRAF